MNIIDKIRAELERYPDVSYDFDDRTLKVPSMIADGFPVSIVINKKSFTVYFDGWHEEFDNEEEALNCFAFGLSDICRLKVHLKGNSPYKWIVQYKEHGIWRVDSTTSVFLYPFWRKPKVKYLKNNLILYDDFDANDDQKWNE